MADIKTRDVTRGSIKTLDRAASSMNHLKEETIRSKIADISGRHDNDSTNTYAKDTLEYYAGDSVAFASRAGLEMLIHSRGKVADGSELITANPSPNRNEQIRRAFREQGVKAICDRQNKAKMIDAEVLRNIEEDRLTGRIRRASVARKKRLSGYSGRVGKKHPNPLRSESIAQMRRKEFTIKRITERDARRGVAARMNMGGRVDAHSRTVRGAGRLMKGIADGSKALLSSVSAGGASAVVILVIMVLFGAAFAVNEDGSYMTGSGDGTIVEVARGELGNVGGGKFWKWYGFSSHVDWCAIFVSWCADQCGYLEMGVVPKFSVVGDGANWFKSRHRWAGRGHKPSPGDIIFFDFEQDGVLDHVGIVENCDGKTVTTIEGNSSNACRQLSYRVGSSQIAGYGLVLVPEGGSKAQMIVRKATQLAYPGAPDEAKYHGGKPTPAYKASLERAYPNRSGWGQPSKDGASCDVFVGTVLVDSGVDKDFPRGYKDQKTRLASKTDLYECVVSTTSRDIKESELKDGDICTWEKASGTVHIWIYAGDKARQASHDKWYPRTTSPRNNLKISGKKVIRIYRIMY
jgi:hypothetical protein